LDLYLPSEQINTLLASSAYHLLTVKRESEAAMTLFQLAGKHSEVLEELCNRLSGVLTESSVFPSDRQFWRASCVDYYDKYIKGGSGSVLLCLEEDNKLELIGTFETLLNLTVFTDACTGRRYSEVLDIIDGLGLFPKHSEEVQPASQHFPSLDGHIRGVADDILVLTVEAARALYVLSEGGGSSFRGVLSEREQERGRLRERVKALVMFAGVVKHRLKKPNTAIALARMEDSMS
jgi:hypothetical protein